MRPRVVAFWFVVFAFSLACAAAALGDIANPSPGKSSGGAVGALILFLLVAAGSGFVMLRGVLSGPLRQRRQAALDREQRILHAAESAGGRVSLAELAAHADLPIADVERVLAGLQRSGQVISRVSVQGAVVYYFPGLAPATPGIEDV